MSTQNQAWLIRRVIYAVGFIAGIIVVLMGKADVGTVDGWEKYLDQLAGLVTVVASGLAAVKTGPESDNSPVVVNAEDVVDKVTGITDTARYLSELTKHIESNARATIENALPKAQEHDSSGTPLDAALRGESS